MAPRFLTDFDPAYGEAVAVADGVVRVVARNPSKYTAWGTGTYVVGDGEVAVIDPGPLLDAHVDAVLAAVAGRRVTHVLVTHTHADHSPAAAAIAAATGAPTYGFGPHPDDDAGAAPGPDRRSERGDAESDGSDEAAVRESGDLTFRPDVVVEDGDVVDGDGFRFECLHTPGHISNHICFAEQERRILLPGDHVMGWSTTVVSPPDGDMADYVANLRRLLPRDEETYLPTHGPPIPDPRRHVADLIAHREERDRQILDLLDDRPRSVDELVAVIYADVRAELHAPAARSVLAHLLSLERLGLVSPTGGGTGSWRGSLER